MESFTDTCVCVSVFQLTHTFINEEKKRDMSEKIQTAHATVKIYTNNCDNIH